jgi:hypothetical protein
MRDGSGHESGEEKTGGRNKGQKREGIKGQVAVGQRRIREGGREERYIE